MGANGGKGGKGGGCNIVLLNGWEGWKRCGRLLEAVILYY